MAWQLSGLDDLVEDFSLSQDNGIIDPCSEFEVTLNFTAGQIGSIEKTLRLEVRGTVPCLTEQGTVSSRMLLGTESGRAAPHRHKGAVTPTSASTQCLQNVQCIHIPPDNQTLHPEPVPQPPCPCEWLKVVVWLYRLQHDLHIPPGLCLNLLHRAANSPSEILFPMV